jgi:phospholipase C
MIDSSIVDSLPHYAGKGCSAIGVMPTDRSQGIENPMPPHFNTLPATLPAYN